MAETKLNVTLVGASIQREAELPGFESVTDFASENYNLAIASIKAAVLGEADLSPMVHVRLRDFAMSWDKRSLGQREAEAVVGDDPHVLGISCYCWSVHTLLDLAARVRSMCADALIVLGGPSAGPIATDLLLRHHFLDAVVWGEGEGPFVELLRARLAGRPLTDVAGLTCRDTEGVPVASSREITLVDLAQLPSPYRTKVLHPKGHSLLLETSRGCRFRCRFCSWMGEGRRLRYTPASEFEADLRWATSEGFTSIKLADTAINFHTERLEELVQSIEAVNVGSQCRFTYFLKPELLTEEQADLLARVPTGEIIIGVESLTTAARRAVAKPPFDTGDFERKMAALHRVGPVTVSLIMGLPGDTLDGLDRTLAFMADFDRRHPDWIHVICLFWLAVLPGSRFYAERDAWGFRLMPRETPYLLESKEHSPDDLLCMARLAAEWHYRHPKIRLEYFHKEYLAEDASRSERRVHVPRRQHDSRRCMVLAGVVEGGPDSLLENVEILRLKAFAEIHDPIRANWRIELCHLVPSHGSLDDGQLEHIIECDPDVILWHAPRWDLIVAALKSAQRRSRARLIVAGMSTGGLPSDCPADVAVLGHVAETELVSLLTPDGYVAPPLARLDDVPSPFQWGFVQRPGDSVAMRLGQPGGALLHGPERIFGDVRWALEQRYRHIVWLDEQLPEDAEILGGFVAAIRRADPDSAIRHSFRSATAALGPAQLEVLAPLITRERIIVSSSPADDIRANLLPWATGVTFAGWTLERLRDRGEPRPGVELTFRWESGARVIMHVPRTGRMAIRLDRGQPQPPRPELNRLVRLMTRRLRQSLTYRSRR